MMRHSHILTHVESFLKPDERLLWIGRPDPGHSLLYNISGRSAPLASIALVLSLFIVAAIIAGAEAIPITLGGITLMGLSLIVQFLVNLLDTRRTIYAVTTQRALIIKGAELQSFDDIEFVEQRGGNAYGDVIFEREVVMSTVPVGYGFMQQPYTVESGFFGVRDPQEAINALCEVFELDVELPPFKLSGDSRAAATA